MEDILREYEVRLLDGQGGLMLIVPVIAGSESDAESLAAKLAGQEKAASYLLTPQMSSRGYRSQKPTSPQR